MRSFITPSMIAQRLCSPSRDGQELLPQLIEKLITASLPRKAVLKIRFPHGNEIYLHGADGVLVVDEKVDHPMIPSGFSFWEMGTESRPQSKADKDFAKAEGKLANAFPNISPQVTASQTSYVFVTSAVFQDHEKWIGKKRGSSSWKSIRVIDAVGLARWLEQCPAVMLWFAKECGLPAEGLYDAEQYLQELGIQFGVALSPELVVAGRDGQVNEVCDLVSRDDSPIHVWGESVEEAAAFVAASVLTNADAFADRSPVVLADSRADLTLLATHNAAMTLVPLDSEAIARAKALKQRGWRTIFPEVATGGPAGKEGGVVLARIGRGAVVQYLVEKLSLPEQRAGQVIRDSKGSLVALLWLIGSGPIGVPRWASRKDATTHASLILVGSWIGDNRDDAAVVERISRQSYRDIETLLQAALVPEGPWIHRGAEWLCASKDFVWGLLASKITETMLADFREMVTEVVGEPDPSLDMPASDRHMANILGKVRKHSMRLRKGLADSVARLTIARSDGQGWANRIVQDLLDPDQPEAERRWLSLVDVYSELAEAAPDTFLTCLDGCLGKQAVSFFQDAEDADMLFGPSSPHIFLLWALERLAWHHEWFPRVLSVLAKLAGVDPGGKMTNRPLNSLMTILLPWSPQHSEGMDKAAEAMDMLHRAAPDVAWRVAVALLPTSWGTTWPTQRPEYRSVPGKREVTGEEYWAFVRIIVERMIVWAGCDSNRLAELIEAYPELRRGWDEVGQLVTDALGNVDRTGLSEDDLATVETSFRKVILRHRRHEDADWALPASDIDLLEKMRQSLMPSDLVLRYEHLFSWDAGVPDAPMEPFEEGWEEWLSEKRGAAAKEIYDEGRLAGLLRLAEQSVLPGLIGGAVATFALPNSVLKELIETALSESPDRLPHSPRLLFGRGYVAAKYRQGGIGWLGKLLKLPELDWTPERHANVALSIPAGTEIWTKVRAWGGEAEASYWRNVEVRSSCSRHWPTVLAKWKEVQRPWSSIELLADVISGRHQEEDTEMPDADQIMSVLEAALVVGSEGEASRQQGQMMTYYIEKLFEHLDSLDPDTGRLGRLEWGWLRVLENTGRGPKVLRDEVTSSPELFVELLKALYRANGEDPPETPDEAKKAMAEQAYHLLRELRTIPGLESEGNVNGAKLQRWVQRSRELAAAVDRLVVCDSQIGDILSYSPESPDGTWPCLEVREILEDIQSPHVENGLDIGKSNQRGVIVRGNGGKQEWDLAMKFKAYADKVRVQWPRSAAVLDNLTRSYEHQARQWDEQAKWKEYE